MIHKVIAFNRRDHCYFKKTFTLFAMFLWYIWLYTTNTNTIITLRWRKASFIILCAFSGRLRPTWVVQVGRSSLRCAHDKWNGNNKCDNCVQFYCGNCASTKTRVFDIPFSELEVETQLPHTIRFLPGIT